MSLLAAVLLASTTQGAAPLPALRFMQQARYHAASTEVDPLAPGGHSVSDNASKPIADARLLADGAKATLRRLGGSLSLVLTNGGRDTVWFRAADGNILAFLEAKDPRGVFRPVQYHPWSTCGNSYHRVALPPRHGWSFAIELGTGGQETLVRWRYRSGGVDVVSNEVPWSIHPTLFDIEPRLRAEQELWLEGDFPVLGRKGIRRP